MNEDTALKILIEQAKQRIENIFTEGWISVETTPENKGERFLTINSNGSYDVCYLNVHGVWISIYTGITFTKLLTHYQPLPANPDESNNNEAKINFAFKELFEYARSETNRHHELDLDLIRKYPLPPDLGPGD